jgi:hypothetical protein
MRGLSLRAVNSSVIRVFGEGTDYTTDLPAPIPSKFRISSLLNTGETLPQNSQNNSEFGFRVKCREVAQTVPTFVPSGRLDAFSPELGQSAETRILTSESQQKQTALNY